MQERFGWPVWVLIVKIGTALKGWTWGFVTIRGPFLGASQARTVVYKVAYRDI